MNELQKEILNDHRFSGLAYSFSETISKIKLEELITQFTWYDLKDGLVNEHLITRQKSFDSILIDQQKDKDKFILYIHARSLDHVIYNVNGKIKKTTAEKLEYKKVNVGYVAIPLSFNNKVESIELHFMFDIVEKYQLNIKYKEYVEPKIDMDMVYKNNISISTRTSNNIVNIFFKKADDKVVNTVLELYLREGYLINTIEAVASKNYFSIIDLAFGKYFYKIAQYDTQDNLIYETELLSFTLASNTINVHNLNDGRSVVRR